jgi:GNAT superfamily N-acetyltransferase
VASFRLLEVLPAYQGRGIGQALMTRMLDRLGHLPDVDLLCDPDVVPFYEHFGMKPVGGIALRRPIG